MAQLDQSRRFGELESVGTQVRITGPFLASHLPLLTAYNHADEGLLLRKADIDARSGNASALIFPEGAT
jgi:hypothetical protein